MPAKSSTASDYKLGTCKWCSTEGDVFRDNMLCDDCDSHTVVCGICKQRRGEYSKCRHVFQDQHFEWRGAGFDPTDAEMMVPFHRLLSAMGEEFARDLKAAIKSRKFYTWLVAPMIGGGGTLTLYGMPERDGELMMFAWGNRLLDLGQGGRAEALSDGYHWLVSLYQGSTTKANRTTITWIDRWLWPFTPTV